MLPDEQDDDQSAHLRVCLFDRLGREDDIDIVATPYWAGIISFEFSKSFCQNVLYEYRINYIVAVHSIN